MIYFTADLHLNHKNIIQFCQRPFSLDEVQEMNATIIDSINNVVGQKDELWVIGDFGLHLKHDDVKKFLDRIICKHTRLVLGNHDSRQHGACFEHQFQAAVVRWNHLSFYLSHYPLRSWREHFQLHGHEHGTMAPMIGQMDVGVDGYLYDAKKEDRNLVGTRIRNEPFGTPWSVEEVVDYVQKRDRDSIVKDACREKHGDRLIVGGYGGRD
jgi:calcineurin-like phosphoesterase family protein